VQIVCPIVLYRTAAAGAVTVKSRSDFVLSLVASRYMLRTSSSGQRCRPMYSWQQERPSEKSGGWRSLRVKPASGYCRGGILAQALIGFWTIIRHCICAYVRYIYLFSFLSIRQYFRN